MRVGGSEGVVVVRVVVRVGGCEGVVVVREWWLRGLVVDQLS